jgi:hypothetical protein
VHTGSTKCFQHVPCERALRFTCTRSEGGHHDRASRACTVGALGSWNGGHDLKMLFMRFILSSSIMFRATT